ncbi:MAG: hypothetical protein N3B11_03565 [Coriobacteriia bacterium]|nr:hypothetical protein [Coriobacteriia bacterium]
MTQPNEVVDLAVALFVTPIILSGIRVFEPRVRAFVVAFVLSLLVALVSTIAEGFAAYQLFNTLEHSMYAVAGALAAAGTIRIWQRGGAWRR